MATKIDSRLMARRVILSKTRRVSVAEVARTAAQEPVEVLNDLFNGKQQPFTRGDLPNALAGVLHGLA
jgi:hypothetical protein